MMDLKLAKPSEIKVGHYIQWNVGMGEFAKVTGVTYAGVVRMPSTSVWVATRYSGPQEVLLDPDLLILVGIPE